MKQYIDKAALVAEIEKLQSEIAEERKLHEDNSMWYNGINHGFNLTKDILNDLEVKEVDIDKMCKFKNCIGYAFPDNASECQKYLACYRQGIEDVLGILKQGLI